jgi:hypothetical protein
LESTVFYSHCDIFRQSQIYHGATLFKPYKVQFSVFLSPSSHHFDGNHSYAELISTNSDGGMVFKIVFCSSAGERAHQEQIKTYLLHIKSGIVNIATSNLGHEGSYGHGSTGLVDSFEFNIQWNTPTNTTPFQATSRIRRFWFQTGNENERKTYTTYQDATLTGTFPLIVRSAPTVYIESDGVDSLMSLAKTLSAFYYIEPSESHFTREQSEKRKARYTDLILTNLIQLNTRCDANSHQSKGTKITLVSHDKLMSLLHDLLESDKPVNHDTNRYVSTSFTRSDDEYQSPKIMVNRLTVISPKSVSRF